MLARFGWNLARFGAIWRQGNYENYFTPTIDTVTNLGYLITMNSGMGPLEGEEMYKDFLEWAEEQGFEFPCTASEFAARATAFLNATTGWNADAFNALLKQGGVQADD